MILHQIEALAAAGVTDIVLAVNYRPEVMEKHLQEVRHFHWIWIIHFGMTWS
jgi:NDP-sugar pyrophosphorylase family protein